MTKRTTTRSELTQSVHDRYWEDQRLAAIGKTVLLVDGGDDRDVLEAFLFRRSPSFATRAGTHPDAYGLVDRDTWTAAEVAELNAAEPRLVGHQRPGGVLFGCRGIAPVVYWRGCSPRRTGFERKGAETRRRKKAKREIEVHSWSPLTTRWMPCLTCRSPKLTTSASRRLHRRR